ncbi:hypothetical protein [Caenibius tardaugens]|nr:hypothetical protein [Caenibius tardaugens]AZI36229.1 hypothetical protein EGO55_09885 [Caenibius tardaugens NBRC 16725]
MRRIMTAIAITALALTSGVAGASQTASEKGEAKLAKMLEGREAGQPVSCISNMQNRDLTVIDRTALVYGSGKTIYVNRTQDPRWIDRDDIIVTKPTNAAELCRMDSMHTMDRSTHMRGGAIMLDDFVPYTKVPANK